MPARLPVTGPAELFVNSGQGTSFAFLGTDEGDPHIEIIPTFSPMYNDAGGAVPFDYLFDGEEAVVAMNLSRWDETVYRSIASRPNAGVGVAGLSRFGNVGQPVVMGGGAFQTVVNFPYAPAAPNVGAGVPPGYFFFACALIGPDDMRVGARLNVIQIIIKAVRVYVGADGLPVSQGSVPAAELTATGPGGFALYTTVLPPGIGAALTS